MAKLVLLTAALLAAVGAWEQTSNVPAADHQIELVFALRHPEAGVAALEKELLERSDPSSPLYSKWLTNNEAHALVDPAPHHKAAVYDHLAAHVSPDAISFPTPNGDFVIATVPVVRNPAGRRKGEGGKGRPLVCVERHELRKGEGGKGRPPMCVERHELQ